MSKQPSKAQRRRQTLRLTLAQTTNWALFTTMGAEGTISQSRHLLQRSVEAAERADVLSDRTYEDLQQIHLQMIRCENALRALSQSLSSHNVNKCLRNASECEKI